MNFSDIFYYDITHQLFLDGKFGITISNIKNKLYYRAYCTINGKQKSKSFLIDKYGEDLAFKLACEWRVEQIKQLNDFGENYTERHGN